MDLLDIYLGGPRFLTPIEEDDCDRWWANLSIEKREEIRRRVTWLDGERSPARIYFAKQAGMI